MCILSDCNKKGKKIYGDYCYKHRRNYLIDSSNQSKTIIIDRWTNKCSDYLKQDIIDNLRDSGYFCKECTTENNSTISEKSKQELFLLLLKIHYMLLYRYLHH